MSDAPTERPDTDRLRRVGSGTDGDGIPLLTPGERAFLRSVASWIEGLALAPAAAPVPLSVDEGLKVREPTSWSLTELIRGVAQSAPTTQPELPATFRDGCCAQYRKPCTYHEGYRDGWEIALLTASDTAGGTR